MRICNFDTLFLKKRILALLEKRESFGVKLYTRKSLNSTDRKISVENLPQTVLCTRDKKTDKNQHNCKPVFGCRIKQKTICIRAQEIYRTSIYQSSYFKNPVKSEEVHSTQFNLQS